jgi:hypothetical protein
MTHLVDIPALLVLARLGMKLKENQNNNHTRDSKSSIPVCLFAKPWSMANRTASDMKGTVP